MNDIEVCTNCGCKGSIEEIRERTPGAVTCCPDRKVVDLIKYLIEHDALKAQLASYDGMVDKQVENAELKSEVERLRDQRNIAQQMGRELSQLASEHEEQRDAAYGILREFYKMTEDDPSVNENSRETIAAQRRLLCTKMKKAGIELEDKP